MQSNLLCGIAHIATQQCNIGFSVVMFQDIFD